MKKTTKLLIGLAIVLSLAALTGVLVAVTNSPASAAAEKAVSPETSATVSTDTDEEYAEGVIDIALGETTTISDEGATFDGSTVKITAAGVYSISGTLDGGQIEVDAEGKVYLEFNGVDITSAAGPALLVTDAKKVTITLVQGTTNSLTDAGSDAESDAALFTNDTLVINGDGTLIVTGTNNEGISSDDDIIINRGTIRVTAVDDGLNAHDDITINGGELYVIAGGDGIDSNGTVNINGGTVMSFGSTAGGDGGLDAVGTFTLMGGTVIAGGNTAAAPSSDSTQASIYVSTGSTQNAGTPVKVTRDGEEILSFTPDKEFQNLLISSGDLLLDATYQVYVGSSETAITVTAAVTPAGAGSMDAPAGAGGPGAPTDLGDVSTTTAAGQQ